jgi:acyl carrier protein phosphodiesterase
MNFLAHCFLSFGDEDVLVGNFMGDFVKGSHWQLYSGGVQRGILLHRVIDSFTDAHPLALRGTARLRPQAGRYAAPVLDILFDHLLVRSWTACTTEPLDEFIRKVYEILSRRRAEFPPVLAQRLVYKTRTGMETVLARFSHRVPLNDQGRDVLNAFFDDLDAFESDFQRFFPALTARCQEWLTAQP